MITYAQWRTMVVNAYQGGEATHAELLRAIVDSARSVMVRDIESDLALARSYENSARAAFVKNAGTPIATALATLIAEAKLLMPIDDDTAASMAILENAIETGRDALNAVAEKWDAYLLQAAIDLQRHVPFFQVRQVTTYLVGTAGVTHEGFISRAGLPEGARVQQLTFGHYYPALEDGVAVAADDIVISNGRAYTIVTGGTPTVYDVATGFVSTDGEEETLGALVATYFAPERDWPVRQMEWPARDRLRSGEFTGGAAYAMAPQRDELWLYPQIDADHRFDLEWVGVADAFGGTDEVTFDQTAAEYAAHFLKAMLTQNELDDPKVAAVAMTLAQRALRKAVLDNDERDSGSPTQVQPYDHRRNLRAYGACCPPIVVI